MDPEGKEGSGMFLRGDEFKCFQVQWGGTIDSHSSDLRVPHQIASAKVLANPPPKKGFWFFTTEGPLQEKVQNNCAPQKKHAPG